MTEYLQPGVYVEETDRPAWRLIFGTGEGATGPSPAEGALNMAVDRALLDAVAAGAAPALRLYRWSRPTLSFGRNQPARGLYDEAAAAERGTAFVRRPTGGQAVLHDDELTYAVVAPVALVGRPREAYRRINEALVSGLRGLGIDAAVSDSGAAPPAPPGAPGSGSGPSWTDACFRRPERGEVVARRRKLVGSAQRTESRTILQHGSILLGGTQAPAEELLRDGIATGQVGSRAESDPGSDPGSEGSPEEGWTTVAAELGRRPDLEGLTEAVVTGFASVLGISLAPSTLAPAEAAAARELRARFASRTWTWRR